MFDGIPVTALGPIGLVVLTLMLPYLQLARGKLQPESTSVAERKNTEYWREAHAISEQARLTMAAQINELLEHARTTDALIRALPRPEAKT